MAVICKRNCTVQSDIVRAGSGREVVTGRAMRGMGIGIAYNNCTVATVHIGNSLP